MAKEKILSDTPFRLSLRRGDKSVTIILSQDIIKDDESLKESIIILRECWEDALSKGNPKNKTKK